MALQLAFDTAHGISLPTAYHRILNLRQHKNNESVFKARIMIGTYVDAAARTAGNPPITTRNYRMDYDLEATDNAFVQAYAYLKTLTDFTGASDV